MLLLLILLLIMFLILLFIFLLLFLFHCASVPVVIHPIEILHRADIRSVLAALARGAGGPRQPQYPATPRSPRTASPRNCASAGFPGPIRRAAPARGGPLSTCSARCRRSLGLLPRVARRWARPREESFGR